MNSVIARITLRQLLSRRRTLLLVLLGLVLVLVALAVRVGGDEGRSLQLSAAVLANVGVATLMPLVALIFGTGAIGSELDDGTAVFLLAKPVRRAVTLVTKLTVAIACSILLTCIPILVAGLIGGGFGGGLAVAFSVAAAIGSAIYCCVFVTLSLITSRALIFGLAYILLWEGLLAGLFTGTRTFSIRQQTLAFTDALSDTSSGVFRAQLDLVTAVVVAVLVVLVAVAIGIRRMTDIEIAGETA